MKPCDLPPIETVRGAPVLPAFEFRAAMRRLTGAVSLVTTSDGKAVAGLTATAVTSFSAEPPRLLACVNLKGTSFRMIAESRRMAVNLLAFHHRELAQRFAMAQASHDARFGVARWNALVTGAPVLADALVAFDCVVDEMMVAHSHAVIIGEIKAVQLAPGRAEPLLYADGEFTSTTASGAER